MTRAKVKGDSEMINQAISYTRRSGQLRPIGRRSDVVGENYLGVPGWVWGAGAGTAALYGAYQLTKGSDSPKKQGALEPESKPWLYKVNPSYWFKSGREKKFVQIEKERGVRNVELQKELSAAERAYAVHQAAAEKAGKVEKLEKEMTTTSGDAFVGDAFVGVDPMDTKTDDARALAVLKKSRVPMEPGSTWSPEQLKLANQVVGSVLGSGTKREIWLKEFLRKNEISWADEKGAIYSLSQGRIMHTPPMSLASKESVLGNEVGLSFGTIAAAATSGLAIPAYVASAYLAYKGGKAIYNKLKGKKKSPEQQREARMAAAYQRKAAALKNTRAMEKRHLAAIAVKESERDIAEAEAQALESEAALQTAQAIALEAEATKDVPQIAEDLSGWAVMGGCPWMKAGPAHIAATNTIAGAALRRGLAAARAARTNPEAREVLMGIAAKAKKGDPKSRQLMGTMKAGVAAERQLLATHDSNLAAKENIVRKSWARVHQLQSLAKSAAVSGAGSKISKNSLAKAQSKVPSKAGVVSSQIPSSIPGEPPDVQVAIAAAASSMGVPPAVAGSVIAAAHAGDKNAKRELDQAEAVYRAAQKGDAVAKKAMAKVVADAKSGYAPAAQKAAIMAAAVGTLKGRAMWQSRKSKEIKDTNSANKDRAITAREYRILSIKLSRYLVGNGPLAPSEAARGLIIARSMKLDEKAQRTWLKAINCLDKPRRKFPPFLAFGTGLGIFRDTTIQA
jgi:hypothetical protein